MFQERKGVYRSGDAWISVKEMLMQAFASVYRLQERPQSEKEYINDCLCMIASMQVEPESIYCEEGQELGDPGQLDHLEDVLRTDGAWVYYGVEAENFFIINHMDSREAALERMQVLCAEPDAVCCLVEL